MTITLLTHRFVRLAIAAVAVALAATTTVSAQQAATYEVVSSFDIAFFNRRAPSSLRQADDGTFYGTASAGGLFDQGTLFRMDATGVVTLLYTFSGSNDGGRPFLNAEIAEIAEGNRLTSHACSHEWPARCAAWIARATVTSRGAYAIGLVIVAIARPMTGPHGPVPLMATLRSRRSLR